jgi:hypothetical protein
MEYADSSYYSNCAMIKISFKSKINSYERNMIFLEKKMSAGGEMPRGDMNQSAFGNTIKCQDQVVKCLGET